MARLSTTRLTPKVVIDFYVALIPKEKTDGKNWPTGWCTPDSSQRAGKLFQ